jgi:hypothetical protein
MGEPPPQHFSRRYDFTAWPVESESELADYADWLIDIVRHAVESKPEVTFSVHVTGREDEEIPLNEFRERFDEFPLNKIFSASLTTWDPHQTVGLSFEMKRAFGGGSRAGVEVSGTDKERVLKIKTKVREEGDARMDAQKQHLHDAKAKEDADADFKRQEAAVGIGDVAGDILRAEFQRERERSGRTGPCNGPESPKETKPVSDKHANRSRLKKILYDPWVIGVTLVVLAAVLALIVNTA